jgi:LysR family transcriptional regulator, nitrogen assimilation regulatory protein
MGEQKLDVRRLGYFMRIAEDGSLTRASNMLRIAQPALSRQMRLLEEELGVPLFTRTARGMRLTEAGQALRASVAGPLRELELALQNIRSYPFAADANLIIGLAPSLAEILATPLALRLDAAFPNIKLRIVEGLTGSLIDWLSRGVVDLVLLEEEAHHDQLRERKLATLPLMLAGPADAPLTSSVPFSEAAKLPLLLPSHHLGLRAVINDAAGEAQTKLNIRMEADSARLTCDLLLAGLGYAMLPACYCREDPSLRLWPLTAPAPKLNIILALRKSSQITSALEDYLANIVTEQLAA